MEVIRCPFQPGQMCEPLHVMINRIWPWILGLALSACQQPRETTGTLTDTAFQDFDPLPALAQQQVEPQRKEPETEPVPPPHPIFGYRFRITGDFDGDGKRETLRERFLNGWTGKEADKYYAGMEYNDFVIYNGNRRPMTIITSGNKAIDTLKIDDSRQSLGLAWLKNEGDLNGDGGDEVSYIPNFADWSETNTCHLMTYSGGTWHKLMEVDVREWMLPELPGVMVESSMFGVTSQTPANDTDSLNRVLEKELLRFPGFFRKVRKNRVRVIHINLDIQEDTVEVELKGKELISLPDRAEVED